MEERVFLVRSVVTQESYFMSSQLQTSMSPESNVAALFLNTRVRLLTMLCNVYLRSSCYISLTQQLSCIKLLSAGICKQR